MRTAVLSQKGENNNKHCSKHIFFFYAKGIKKVIVT